MINRQSVLFVHKSVLIKMENNMKSKSATMIQIDVQPDELMSALQEAMMQDDGDGGFQTVNELTETLHLHDRKVRKLIGKLLAQGKVVVGKVRRSSIDGRFSLVPAYKIRRSK